MQYNTNATWHLDFCSSDDDEYPRVVENPPTDWQKQIGQADIFIWQFYNAPKELRELSVNGGDEDWLVIMKKEFATRQNIGFIYHLGVFCLDCLELGDWVMVIGSHS